jgi:CHAT domain-containing protein
MSGITRPRSYWLTIVCALVLSNAVPPLAADDPPVDSADASVEFKTQLKSRIESLRGKRDWIAAVAAAELLLTSEREDHGPDHVDALTALSLLSDVQLEAESFDAARQSQQQLLGARLRRLGSEHWQLHDARRRLAHIDLLAGMTAEQRNQVANAAALNNQVEALGDESKYAEARPLAEEALRIRRNLLGATHPDTLESLSNLGWIERDLRHFDVAEPLLLEAVKLRQETLGEQHPDYAYSLNVLAWLYVNQGDYARGESCFRNALSTYKLIGDEKAFDWAMNLNNLSRANWALGRYSEAEQFAREALVLRKRVLGELHPDYVDSLNNLANVLQSEGQIGESLALCKEILSIDRKLGAEGTAAHALHLSNLAFLYRTLGDFVNAATVSQQSLEIRRRVLDKHDPVLAFGLWNAAQLHISQGEFEEAEPLLREAMDIRHASQADQTDDYADLLLSAAEVRAGMNDLPGAERLCREAIELYSKILGDQHRLYAKALLVLGNLQRLQGDNAGARATLDQALHIYATATTPDHPEAAFCQNGLALCWLAAGDTARAEAAARESLRIARKFLDLTAASQSGRQQLASAQQFRRHLDTYLSIVARAPQFAENACRETLAWKGRILVREQLTRAVADDSAIAPKFAELQSTASRLARIALATPEPAGLEDWRTEIARLSAAKEQLEAELSALSADYRRSKQDVTLEDVLTALPSDVTVVDYVEFADVAAPAGDAGDSRRLIAFVLHPRRPVTLHDLGEARPLLEAIDTWRLDFGMTARSAAAGELLRERIWTPLEPELAGARIVLISPDGGLGRLPFSALPGKARDRYLLEDWPIVILPVLQTLPALVNEAGRKELRGNLLLMGNIDYDTEDQPAAPRAAAPPRAFLKRSAARSGTDPLFPRLTHTEFEVQGIQSRYHAAFGTEGIRTFEGRQASEEEFRQQATQHYYLHLATHGFFAPPQIVSALAPPEAAISGNATRAFSGLSSTYGYDPGLLSGVVLAGANHPDPARADDGILTAEEVATLDLRGVRLAVLSACETGLGAVAGGEGLLGVQRAFQVAGARTTIASLWKVDDAATLQLMMYFYDKLWTENLDCLSALRAAQLQMLNETRVRALKLPTPTTRTSPELWGAFVLSGYWQ